MAGGALSHLDAALVALCDGDHAEDLVAIERALAGSTSLSVIAAAIRTATAEIREARKLLVGSNVKPAPFFLNEKTVKDLLDRPVEVEDKLVDRPRRSEDPRLAKANDDTPDDDTPDEPADNPLIEPAPEPVPSPDTGDAPFPEEFGSPDHLSQARLMVPPDAEELAAQRAVERAYEGHLAPGAEKVRRSDRLYRQTRDNDARELEQPVDERMASTDRLDTIRAAARKLQNGTAIAEPAERPKPIRVSGGTPARFRAKPVQRASEKRAQQITPRREAKALPPLPFEQRKARLQAAETFLKKQGILVTVIDRAAQIRTYRVTGVKSAVLAEQVIEMAVARGMSA